MPGRGKTRTPPPSKNRRPSPKKKKNTRRERSSSSEPPEEEAEEEEKDDRKQTTRKMKEPAECRDVLCPYICVDCVHVNQPCGSCNIVGECVCCIYDCQCWYYECCINLVRCLMRPKPGDEREGFGTRKLTGADMRWYLLIGLSTLVVMVLSAFLAIFLYKKYTGEAVDEQTQMHMYRPPPQRACRHYPSCCTEEECRGHFIVSTSKNTGNICKD